ncbi:MAG TPA: GlsB/YeaQ/YmgE family stress response membrane protein [Saprospiraceae bacterium]|nr:GlsB/YeaQ/YmgE family stress response membrane protein [Saprospiraceae bacterium]HNL40203.1 GlsB/YeaQ/YmgE family stress response membrane protein [Saprospiraceae bacterium]HNM27084.1 GlsB/YeaQ/YmgE family stress response membrane protein [Saprospiraceae bacterium]
MELSQLLAILLIGAVSGWLAGIIRQGFGFGLWGNMIVGILGAFIGQWLFERLNIHMGTGLLNQIFTSVVGALVLLFVIGLFKNK